MNKWNKDEKCFNLNGYKYSLPSIGVESSLTSFLIDKSYGDHSEKYSKYSYSFVYFLNNKQTKLRFNQTILIIWDFNLIYITIMYITSFIIVKIGFT